MKKILTRVYKTYINPCLDFRVRLFNMLAIGGTIISFAMAVVGIFINIGIVNITVSLFLMVLSFTLFMILCRIGRHQICLTERIYCWHKRICPAAYLRSERGTL
ncbi:MAG: hypothetical protein LBS62_09300 [Clostridiales bacterium]|jgi:hypothetical protein|nr:hypothetical protein [Clostridiales bacterium]